MQSLLLRYSNGEFYEVKNLRIYESQLPGMEIKPKYCGKSDTLTSWKNAVYSSYSHSEPLEFLRPKNRKKL